MTDNSDDTAAPSAGWRGTFAAAALGFAVFSILWFVAAAVGTKLGLWDWQFGLLRMSIGWGPMILMAAGGVSVLALIISLIKAPRKQPFMLALGALLISGLALGRVAAFGATASQMPPLHDIQTDWSDPVQPSDALLTERENTGAQNLIEDDPVIIAGAEARWPGMGGRPVAEVQEEAEFDTSTQEDPRDAPYPMLAPLVGPQSVEQGYAAALAAVEDRGWDLVIAQPEEGRIEATETSFWFGFKDDILIRVRPDGEGVRIDVRSVSRVGLSDLGANAKRVRDLLNEIEARLNKPA